MWLDICHKIFHLFKQFVSYFALDVIHLTDIADLNPDLILDGFLTSGSAMFEEVRIFPFFKLPINS